MMNFNKSANNNPPNRRGKTVPLNAANNMSTNPSYNNNTHSGHSPYTQNNTPNNSVNHTQYNSQAMSPRNANTNTKSPRPTKKKKAKKKDKRSKNITVITDDNVLALRERSQTTPHNINILTTNNNNTTNNNPNNNNPHQLYMSTTQHIPTHQQKMNNQTWVSPQQRSTMNSMNRPNSPHINNRITNNRHNKPPPPHREPQWKSQNNINNINKIGATTHNPTGTMIAHNTIESDDGNDLSNQSPITGVTAYHNRHDCVWSINLFQQPEVVGNFVCQTCGDIPKIAFAYTCGLDLIYCEYCIDIKYRKNEIKQKKRMPQMVQNMINELKIKCARYAQCKFRGNVRGLAQHYKLCIEKIKKKANNKSGSECPLKYIGCTQFNGGYMNQHYIESQQQHFNLVISFFENKFRKYDNKMQQTDLQLKQLQKQNLELKHEIALLQTSNNTLSQQMLSLLKNKHNNNNKNGYKIVVNKMNSNSNGDRDNNNGTKTDGQWNSFVNAHRRLSTKTGATMPGNGNGTDEDHMHYSAQLLSNPQSYATAVSSSYDSSMHTGTDDTTSEGWYRNLPNHPLLKPNRNIHNNNNSKPKLQNKIIDKRHNNHLSHNTQDTQTENSMDTLDDDATYIPEDMSVDDEDGMSSVTNQKIIAKIKNLKAKGMVKHSSYFVQQRKKKLLSKNELSHINEDSTTQTISYKQPNIQYIHPGSQNTSTVQSGCSSMTTATVTDSAISDNSQDTNSDYLHIQIRDESVTNFGPTLDLIDIDEASTANSSFHKNRLNIMDHIRGKARSRSTSYQREIIGKHGAYSQQTAPIVNPLSSSSISPPSPPRDVMQNNQSSMHAITPWENQQSFPSHINVVYDDDDEDDDTTNNSKNDTNNSCTISVRRAIQHLVPNYYDDAKQMELPISDQKMVVIDIGSQLSKVGLAGSNKPAVIFQSMVAKHKLNGSRTIIGDKIDKLTNYQCGYPIDRGIIKNYGDYESIIHSIFYDKLQINPHEYNALMIEPILSPKKQSNKILEICFSKFNLNALFLAVDALCALYASGGNTGLSVSSGHGVTCVVPIYEGYVIPHAAQRLEYGGYDISNYLKDKLNLHGLFRSLLSENKFADSLKQKLSYVAQDYKSEKQHTMFERIVYRLPDGSEIEVGQERFECTEPLFNNLSISNLVNKSLLNASDDIRQVLFENIVCSGGNTMLKGFDERLKKEVDNNAPENSGWKTRVFGLVDRKLSCWIGGSIMASLSHMDQLWITRKQYQDIGPNILNRQY